VKRITCGDSEALRGGLVPLAGITNWVDGEVLNWELPEITATTWGYSDGTEVMRDELDRDGCRHWLIEGGEQHGE